MTKIKRWSKPVDWEVYIPGDVGLNLSKYSDHFELEKQMEALSYYHDGIITAVEQIMDSNNEKESFEIAMKFKEEYYGWQSFGTFYSGGLEMNKLYLQLNSHYWLGYKINDHWKRFIQAITEIWEYIPVIYKALKQNDINEIRYKKDKPFPDYQRPHDLDENFNIIVEKSKVKRWSKKFDGETYLREYLKDWNTLSHALSSLEEYAKELSADMYLEFTAEKLYSTNGMTELYIEPPGDYFGSNITDNTVYYNIHNTLHQLTEEGYDIRSEWCIYRNAMRSIWQDTKKMYLRDWIAACNALVSKKDIVDPMDEIKELRKVKNATNISEGYDPNNPFPFYPIPEDIDE